MKYRLYSILLVLLFLGIGEVSAREILSSDGAAPKDIFKVTENVYAMGDLDGAPGEVGIAVLTADIYVTNDRNWVVNDTIVGVKTKTTITTLGGSGTFIKKVWSTPLTVGKYDLVLDEDQNGRYDKHDVVYKGMAVGFTVVPEFPTVALPVISIVGLMLLFQRRKGK